MGTIINFFQNITPARERDDCKEYYFPCEDKHSFNPHYQHNLSSSPSSSPPSLSSSPSSPSSNYSASSFPKSSSSIMHHSYFNYHGYNASSTSLINTNATPKHDHSYHKQHIRKQNQRYNSYHQQEPLEEWMFGVTEDDHEDYGMTRASPQESPISPSSSSSSTGSLKSSFSRKNTLGNNSRATVTFSHVVLEHPVQQQKPQRQLQQLFSQASASSTSSLGLLPSISESGSQATVTLGTPSTTFSATSSKQHQQQSAKQSLMRIAHCTKSDDGWCSQKAGQYTRHYANASTRGVRTEGRRTGRF